MKRFVRIRSKILQMLVLTSFIVISQPSNAHLLGIAWTDIGNHTVRFYAEIAHDGLTDVAGGSLQIGPWASRQLYQWTGIVNDTTFEELGIEGMAYWDGYDQYGTLTEAHRATHDVAPGTYGNFFYVDVPNFVTGEYILSAESCCSAADRPLSYTYLNAYISVPEPSVLVLFAIGLLLLAFTHGKFRRRGN